jgi:hypothetical protein
MNKNLFMVGRFICISWCSCKSHYHLYNWCFWVIIICTFDFQDPWHNYQGVCGWCNQDCNGQLPIFHLTPKCAKCTWCDGPLSIKRLKAFPSPHLVTIQILRLNVIRWTHFLYIHIKDSFLESFCTFGWLLTFIYFDSHHFWFCFKSNYVKILWNIHKFCVQINGKLLNGQNHKTY